MTEPTSETESESERQPQAVGMGFTVSDFRFERGTRFRLYFVFKFEGFTVYGRQLGKLYIYIYISIKRIGSVFTVAVRIGHETEP